jgi:hypothetical protein
MCHICPCMVATAWRFRAFQFHCHSALDAPFAIDAVSPVLSEYACTVCNYTYIDVACTPLFSPKQCNTVGLSSRISANTFDRSSSFARGTLMGRVMRAIIVKLLSYRKLFFNENIHSAQTQQLLYSQQKFSLMSKSPTE